MQEGETQSELTHGRWDVALVGRILDDRGQAALEFLRETSNQVMTLDYNPKEFTLEIDGKNVNAEELEDYLRPYRSGSIVLETTTLGFVEMFLCCVAARGLGATRLDFLYVEPERYSLREDPTRRSQLLFKRDFELSGEVPGYRAIPGATLMLSDRVPQRCVFFLGYEERRLDRALEDYQMIQPSMCSVVFGVPAFRPGWEMDAFANNIRVIRERNIRGGVHFCGAENPAYAFEVLEEIYMELVANEKLFVGPLGTKPSGVAVALFAASHQNVGIYTTIQNAVRKAALKCRDGTYTLPISVRGTNVRCTAMKPP